MASKCPKSASRRGKSPEGTIRVSRRAPGLAHPHLDLATTGAASTASASSRRPRRAASSQPDAEPSPEEADNLIFHPGLSTAAAVTDVSGRGVGMDVVRRNVEALGGRITVEIDPGRGCRFTLACR